MFPIVIRYLNDSKWDLSSSPHGDHSFVVDRIFYSSNPSVSRSTPRFAVESLRLASRLTKALESAYGAFPIANNPTNALSVAVSLSFRRVARRGHRRTCY